MGRFSLEKMIILSSKDLVTFPWKSNMSSRREQCLEILCKL